jgi:XTP/dITP diphosphohydrolase
VCGLADLPGHGAFREPEEHGATFEENARIKALSYAAQTGRVCLADDSGLVIDALGGRPGVISSHYATDGRETGIGREARDRRNLERVLRELEGVGPERRGARFVDCMCLARPPHPPRPPRPAGPGESWHDAVLAESRGAFEGRIGVPPRVPSGPRGFGYDPIFLVAPDFARTAAELPTEEKNRLSHRARAGAAMAERLRALGEPRA